MTAAVKDALAIGAYVVAIIGAIAFFAYAVTEVLDREQPSATRVALAIVAGLVLLFFIFGGYLWFRLLDIAG